MGARAEDPLAEARRRWLVGDGAGVLALADRLRAERAWPDGDARWGTLGVLEAQCASFTRGEVEARTSAVIDLARAHGWPHVEGRAQVWRCVARHAGRDPRPRDADLRAAAVLCGADDPVGQAHALAFLASDLAFRGRLVEADGLVRQVEGILAAEHPDEPELALILRLVGYARAHLDDLDGAGRAFDEAGRVVARWGYVFARPQVELWTGILRFVHDRLEEAIAHLERAADEAAALGLAFEEVHARMHVAKTLERQGRSEAARAVLDRLGVAPPAGHDAAYSRGREALAHGDFATAEAALAPLRGHLPSALRRAIVELAAMGAAARRRDWPTWDAALQVADHARAESPPDIDLADLAMRAARETALYARTPIELGRAALAFRMVAVQAARIRDDRRVRTAVDALAHLFRRGAHVPVGSFLLVTRLGGGATGEVWRAVRPEGGEVAIKLLAPGADERLATQLDDEIRATAALDHPNVVWVVDHGRVDAAVAAAEPRLRSGTSWLALELAPHGTLADRCGRLPWAEIRRTLLELLDALAHAHARGLVHLDLKPANVLLGGASERPTARLADFGIAHRSSDPSAPRIAGTPAYMAPEQILGRADEIGPWTDLYALGCTAVDLVQGAPPFAGTTLDELRRAHLYEPVPDLHPVVTVPDGLRGWIGRLLAKEPVDRFRRAADAARALRALDGAPEPPEPPAAVRPRLLREAGVGLFGLRHLPMVGRHRERVELRQALAAVAGDGRPRAVALRGPVGRGATRLAEWLAQWAHERGLADTVRVLPGTDPSARVLPVLTAARPERPFVVHVDDADPSSVEGVRGRLGAPVPALFVLTGDVAPPEAALVLALEPLPDDDMDALLDAALPLAPAARVAVRRAARGEPGLALQILADLAARRRLAPGPDGLALPDGEVLPTHLDALWEERLSRVVVGLPARERHALAVLGVLGDGVRPIEWVAACEEAGATASGALVDRLRRGGLLVVREDRWWFVRASVREAAARGASEADRAACARAR